MISPNPERHEVVVIGAGQCGLAAKSPAAPAASAVS
jgi:thioredoxin reductase